MSTSTPLATEAPAPELSTRHVRVLEPRPGFVDDECPIATAVISPMGWE